MRRILLLIILNFSSAICFADEDLLRNTLLRPGSNAALTKELGQECAQALIHFYSSGQILESPTIKKNLTTLETPALKQCSNLDAIPVYHWGHPGNLMRKFSNLEYNKYSDLIAFRRSLQPVVSQKGAAWSIQGVLYIAIYPHTSSSFGNHLVTLWLDQNVKVVPREIFDPFHGYRSVRPDLPIVEAVKKELPPSINTSCDIRDIILFILEDSGAHLVDYSPITEPSETKYNNNGWFYLLNASPIKKHSMDIFPNYRATYDEISQHFALKNRLCEMP
jgi:hypothetical protein